jgi:hypothetical protein
MNQPPAVRETEFVAVDTTDEAELWQRFDRFVRSLHSYLNQLACLQDLQDTRRKWKVRTTNSETFGNFATDPKHWYTFHHGGRNEAQFNVGLWPNYLRVGLGFEFTLRKGGDPTIVGLTYSCFTTAVASKRTEFQKFVADNKLEIEWTNNKDESIEFVPTNEVVSWLFEPPNEPGWIFVGRLLRRGTDAQILENPDELGKVMQAVMCGLRPLWEETPGDDPSTQRLLN